MSDPITIATASGIASGLATFWSMEASAWVKSFFVDHHPKAIEKAQQNTAEFLIELYNRVGKLENKGIDLTAALEDPDFSAAFQKAVLTSAQTENKEKHEVLAEILSQRLTSESESLLALTTKMAVDVVAFLTPKQLEILALAVRIFNVNPITPITSSEYDYWLLPHIAPYVDLDISELDLKHLESLSCLKTYSFYEKDLYDVLAAKNNNTPPSPDFVKRGPGKYLESLWNERLSSVELTSVGLLIGMNIYSIKTNSNFPADQFK